MKTISSKALLNLGRLSILGAALIWGTSFVILKSALNAIPPMFLLAIRFSAGALILLPFCAKYFPQLNGKTLLGGLAMGSCLFFAYIFQTLGLEGTSPGKNAFLSASYCLIVPFLYWIFQRQCPSVWTFIAAPVCLAGIALVSFDGAFVMGLGDGLSLISGIFFALHIVVTYRVTKERSPLLMTMLQFTFAALYCWGGALLFETFPQSIPADAFWRLAYLCVMATCITLLLQSFGQKHCPPSSAAMLLTLESVFGVIFSVLLGAEQLRARVVTGFVLIFLAILISETRLSFLRRGQGNDA